MIRDEDLKSGIDYSPGQKRRPQSTNEAGQYFQEYEGMI